MSKHQHRLTLGHHAQISAANALIRHIPNSAIVSVAPPGSVDPDIVLSINKETIQFEVKHCKKFSNPLVLINKQVRRGSTDSLNDITRLILQKDVSFIQCVDDARASDQTIGFPSDDGVQISGKLPQILTAKTTDQLCLDSMYAHVIHHLHTKGDNYVAVVNSITKQVFVFFTGLGSNIIMAPPLPTFKSVSLKTYGSPVTKTAGVRVGLNIILDITDNSAIYKVTL